MGFRIATFAFICEYFLRAKLAPQLLLQTEMAPPEASTPLGMRRPCHPIFIIFTRRWLAILLAVLSVLWSASMILSFYKVGEMQKDMYNPHLCISTCSTPEKDRTEDKRKTVPVFYNVFTEPKSDGSLTKSIVEEQMKRMRAFHQVFVRSTGKPIQIENATILQHDDEGDESQTLGLLCQHCVENPSDTVVYLHSKGSFHATEENNRLRRFLTRLTYGTIKESASAVLNQRNKGTNEHLYS